MKKELLKAIIIAVFGLSCFSGCCRVMSLGFHSQIDPSTAPFSSTGNNYPDQVENSSSSHRSQILPRRNRNTAQTNEPIPARQQQGMEPQG